MGRTVNGVTTSFAPDVNTPLPAVLESHGAATTRYLYGMDLLAERTGTAWLYYHADALGSTRSLTDGLGEVTGSYVYAPFGNQLYANGPAVDFRFTGEQADDPTGLYFLRARYYDPVTGRFTQRDPFAGMLKTPQTLNPYLYAINNPVILTDYSGKSPFPFPSLFEVGSNPGWENNYQFSYLDLLLEGNPCGIEKSINSISNNSSTCKLSNAIVGTGLILIGGAFFYAGIIATKGALETLQFELVPLTAIFAVSGGLLVFGGVQIWIHSGCLPDIRRKNKIQVNMNFLKIG